MMSKKNTSARLLELNDWFSQRKLKKTELAKKFGVSPSRMSQLLRGIYLSPSWRARLEREGVPGELLPRGGGEA